MRKSNLKSRLLLLKEDFSHLLIVKTKLHVVKIGLARHYTIVRQGLRRTFAVHLLLV